MKLVAENINESIKHLSGKSEEEMEAAFEKDLEDIATPYRNPEENYKIVERLTKYLEQYLPRSMNYKDDKKERILGTLLWNIDTPVLKEAIRQTMNDYMFG